MRLERLTGFLDETLDIDSFESDSSINGLQVEGRREVRRIALAVDACRESISRTARMNAEMLIVHHGLLWGKERPVTGIFARRLSILLEKGISLYAAHLPLDCHPGIGNNASLAAALGMHDTRPFGDYRGISPGLCGSLPRKITVKGLCSKLRRLLSGPVQAFSFGTGSIATIGIVSGGGGSLVQAAADAGCDALLTGETSHAAYHTARENGIDIVFAGHYATEKAGVRALGALLESTFGLETRFIDLPTGL